MKIELRPGTYVPIVTPFTGSGAIDYESLDRLIDRLLMANVEALVVLGTTGESPTITTEETTALIRHTVSRARGSTAVVAGVGSNNTHTSMNQAKQASDLGVDGLLVVCPYYSKPTQQGLYEHFAVIADQVPVPQIVYNIVGRTGVNIETDTLLKLAAIDNIVGVKESSDDINQVSEVVQHLPEGFLVLSGCDHLNFSTLCLGGNGVISTVANLVPEKIKTMVDAALRNNIQTARQIHFEIQPLVTGCSIASNPIPVKTALALMGEIGEVFRQPLCSMEPVERRDWQNILRQQSLLNKTKMKNDIRIKEFGSKM